MTPLGGTVHTIRSHGHQTPSPDVPGRMGGMANRGVESTYLCRSKMHFVGLETTTKHIYTVSKKGPRHYRL